MLGKRSALVLLAGLNIVLVVALFVTASASPTVYAQGAATSGGGFVAVTAKGGGQTFDVLYVLDAAQHQLFAFVPSDPRTHRVAPVVPRDLARDFD